MAPELASRLSIALPDESWGDKFTRCRAKRYAHAKDALPDLEAIGLPANEAMLSRIAERSAPPTGVKARQIATAVLVLVDVHPAALGLDLDELPRAVYERLQVRPDPDPEGASDLLSSSSRCTLRSPGQLALLAA